MTYFVHVGVLVLFPVGQQQNGILRVLLRRSSESDPTAGIVPMNPYSDTHVYVFDSYLVQNCFPERLITKNSSGKQADVWRPKKLEAESRDGQNTKKHTLDGVINYFGVRVQEKRSCFFCSVFTLSAENINCKKML